MQTSIYNAPADNFAFGGGSQDTVIHPAVAVALAVVIVLMLVRPRKSMLAPLFLFLFLVPLGQEFYVAGFHLYCTRILIVVGLARLAWARFSKPGSVLAGGFNVVDGAFLTWAFYRALAGTLLYMQMGALFNQVAFLWDVVGMYVLLRFLIQDQDDIERLFKVFAILAAVIAAEMVQEHYTKQNLFGTILGGGVRAQPEIRLGLIRAQGVFLHSLMAGSFGAALFPLFVWLWKSGQSRFLAVVGMVSSVVITLASSVSTPILAFAGGVALICAWPVRGFLKIVRYGTVVALIGLHMVMKAPVWFLIARIDVVGGSTSYQRAELIDLFIRHFSDWWLIGTNQNGNWGWDMWDTTNQFVAEGERGGLVAFLCFIALIVLSYKHLARARSAASDDRNKQWFLWLLGASLFVDCVAFFGANYYDQTRFAWYALLAMISAATYPLLGKNPAAEPQSDPGLAPSRLASQGGPTGTRHALPLKPVRVFKPRPAFARKLDES